MPTRTAASRRWVVSRRLAATAVLTLGLLMAEPGAAQAHSGLIGTDPADGASLDIAPAQVVLTFNEAPQPLGTQVQVLGPDGEEVSTGEPVVTDTQITQPLAEARPAGSYTVLWRMTSTDGHPLTGQYTFTVATPAGAPVDDPTGTVAPSTPPTPPPTPTMSPVADVTTSATDDQPGWRWGPTSVTVLAVVVVIAAGLVVAIIWLRRKVMGNDTSQ